MIKRLRDDVGLACVLVAIVCVVALYAPTLGYGLVNHDDPWLVRDNWIVQDASWSSLHTIFFDLSSPRRFVLTPEYLPVRDLSIMFDFAVWGHRYEGFHLTNLVIYVIAICVWFSALAQLGIDRKIAGAAILIWALHPTHAESVAWIAERKGLLAMMFAGVCALAYARYRTGSTRWLVLAAIAAVCAVWSKAPGAAAIFAIAVLELVLPAPRIKRNFVGLAVIGAVTLAAFIPVAILASTASVIGEPVDAPAGRIAMVFGVHGFYLKASALAVTSSLSYPLTSHGPSALELGLGAVGLVGALACAIRGRGAVRAGALIWLVGWLPASHAIVPLKMIFVADRYLLFPTLGFALVVAAALARVPRPALRHALLAAIVLAAGMRTLSAQASWRDSETLWKNAIASNPADGIAWSLYADAVAERGGDGEAVIAEALTHTHAPRLLQRQALLVLPTDRARGIALLREAARGGEAIAMSNLALLLLEDRALEEAMMWARSAALSWPTVHAKRTLGKVALAAGHADEALVAFTHALALEPSCTNHFNVALALVMLNRTGALPHLDPCMNDPRVGPRVRELRARAR